MTRKPIVVDTNVIVVANGRQTHADLACQLACTEALQNAKEKSLVLVDNQNLIFEEYQRHANHSGEPGTGDAFFSYLYDNQYSGKVVRQIPITPVTDEKRGFEELPNNILKGGDRAILAVAVVGNAPIVNATDSDWAEQAELVEELGIAVTQLCPQHAIKPN
ncbi:MAG TPA: hypothetical protein VIZ90_15645 [Rhizobiaceae bacterium]